MDPGVLGADPAVAPAAASFAGRFRSLDGTAEWRRGEVLEASDLGVRGGVGESLPTTMLGTAVAEDAAAAFARAPTAPASDGVKLLLPNMAAKLEDMLM